MGLLHHPLQRKLSLLIGAHVTFEKLNVSLLGGSLDAHGVTVAGDDPSLPVLTIKRVRAELSLAKALKKEIVIKSLTIERPVFTIVRRADGRTNLPKRMNVPHGDETDDNNTETADDSDDARSDGGRWRFGARKILLVDGEVHFRSEHGAQAGYHLAAEKVLAEVKESAESNGVEFTCIIDSAGRRDVPADLGALKFTGAAQNVPDLSQWSAASVHANLEIGERLRVSVHCPELRPLAVRAELNGATSLRDIVVLLPPGMGVVESMKALEAAGEAEVVARATYDADKGLRVPELTLKARDVSIPLRALPPEISPE